MKKPVKSGPMLLTLCLLAACSGGDDAGTAGPAPVATQTPAPSPTPSPSPSPAASQDAFDLWSGRLMADAVSPAIATPADYAQAWTGANGKPANVVVLAPRTLGKATVSLSPPDAGADATTLVQAAVAKLRRQGGGVLTVAPGEYRFRAASTEAPGNAHVVLSGLTDVDVQASGATFVFEGGLDGILLQDVTRVRLSGLALRDARVLSGYGRIRVADGTARLVLDEPLPSGGAVNWVQQIDENGRTFPLVQARAILPLDGDAQAERLDARTFTAKAFRNIADGARVAVRFSFYGARAIYLRDTYRGTSQDVSFERIRLGSVAGMGLLIKTRGRGVALVDSTISAEDGRPHGTNYDGIHLVAAAGDILIRNNTIANTGDDPINLRSIIHPATPQGADSATLTNDARFVRQDDEVAFFDSSGEYLGTRKVKSAPPPGNSDTVTFAFAAGPSLAAAAFARVIELTPRRWAIVGNRLSDGAGRGLLAQIPDGLIQGNTIARFPRSAMRLLTSFSPWLEGAGAINVRIADNRIEDGGAEIGTSYAAGIVTILGEVIAGQAASTILNGPVRIENNRFVSPRATCIAAYSAREVHEQDNRCG